MGTQGSVLGRSPASTAHGISCILHYLVMTQTTHKIQVLHTS